MSKYLISILLLVVVASACGPAAQRETPSDMETLTKAARETRVEFVSLTREKLDVLQTEMEELESGLEETEAETRAELDDVFHEWKLRYEKLEGELSLAADQAEGETEENWERVQSRIDATMDELRRSYAELKGRVHPEELESP